MIYLLKGEERLLLTKQLDKIIAAENISREDIVKIDSLELPLSAVIDEANMPSMFSDKKTILVNNPYYLTDKKVKTKIDNNTDELDKYLDNQNPDANLIFFANYEKLSGRKKIVKKLEANSVVFEARKVVGQALISGVQRAAEAREIDIKLETLKYLIDLIPQGLELIIAELDRFKNFDGEITKEVIDRFVSKPPSQNVFELTDAIAKCNKTKIMKIYRDLTIVKNQEMMILGLISSQFSTLLLVKKLMVNIRSSDLIAEKLGKHPYMIKKSMSQARTLSLEVIDMIVLKCVQLDYNIKTGNTEIKMGLELLILEIITSI